jgi:CubicO group peptidase (beta-lactamase class C family)
LQSVNNRCVVDGLLTAAVNIAGMIPHTTHTTRRLSAAVAVALAPLVAIPMSPAAATASPLESDIQSILELALAPGAIDWNCCGGDAPPTGVNAAVRIPGRDDIVVAAGVNVDGTPFDPRGRYPTGSFQPSLVNTVAWQLADDGALDLDATIDTWVPDLPNADRVTIDMLTDYTTGWGRVDKTTPIVADLARRWTLAEVLEGMVGIPPLREPGTAIGTEAADHDTTALAYILEQITGESIAELIETRIITPLGLDDTIVYDGTSPPDGFQHGVFVLGDQVLDSSMVPSGVAYYTYFGAVQAVVSTSSDLLDLLDALVAGELFTTDRTPTAERLLGARLFDGAVYGLGTPLSGFCPCDGVTGNRMEVTAVGRRPGGVGTNLTLVRFSDGISVVLHFNSNEWVDNSDLWDVAVAIHDAAADTVDGDN